MKKEIEAYKKGYRVTEIGSVIGLDGSDRLLFYREDGYVGFSFRDSTGKCRPIMVHRLQAFQKYGMMLFDEGMEVRHANGIKNDNSFDNILIGSHSENMMDVPEQIRKAKGLHASSFIKKHNAITIISYHNENGRSYKKTMAHFSISSKGTLHYILKQVVV